MTNETEEKLASAAMIAATAFKRLVEMFERVEKFAMEKVKEEEEFKKAARTRR